MKKSARKDHEYIISFEIFTKFISLDALSKRIGIDASSGSRNRGQKIQLGKKKLIEKYTWFRLFSTRPKTANLETHLDSIINLVEKSKVFKKGKLPKDSHLSICIAEIYNFNKYAYYQIDIPKKCIAWCGKHSVALKVVAYPSV